jgi:hypothetical protein
LFYEYFYKAVIKDLVWNDRIDAPRPGPDDRLGTRIAKAYTYSLIANHYYAWVYRWSAEGKRFVHRMLGEIRKDEQDGICKKWEDMYKKISKATKQGKAQRVDEDDESEEQFDVDENVLYAEV